MALLGLEIVVYLAATFPGVRTAPAFDPLVDGWLQGAGYVTAAALAVLRPVTSRVHRRVIRRDAAAGRARAPGFPPFLPHQSGKHTPQVQYIPNIVLRVFSQYIHKDMP